MLFGLVNYVVQNQINKGNNLIKQRSFVLLPIFISNLCIYPKKNKYIIHFVLVVIFLLLSFIIIPILFSNYFDSIIKNNDPGYFFSLIASIDIELFLYCFHFFSMACYVSGRNVFFSCLNAPFYLYFIKLGFWISLGTPTVTYITIYLNDANFNLSFFMVIIYGFIILCNLIIISIILFIIMEMPYKKLIKLYFNIKSKLNKVILEDVSENSSKNNSIVLNELNENNIINDNNNNDIDDEDD